MSRYPRADEWRQSETDYLREHYTDQSDAEMSVVLKRTPGAVGTKRAGLGLFRAPRNPNTTLAGQVRALWRIISPEAIAAQLGIAEGTVRDTASKNGMGRSGFKRVCSQNAQTRPSGPKGFTTEQLKFAIADRTGISRGNIYRGGMPEFEADLIYHMAREGKLMVVA